MKCLLLAILLVSLHSAPARADGFFDPPEPTPERRAELDALCSRLENLGLPVVPPDAEWGHIVAEKGGFRVGDLRDEYFDRSSHTATGNAWRLPFEESGGTNVFLSVDGCRIVLPPESGSQPAWEKVRVQRDIVALRKALDENAGHKDDWRRESAGKALLFAAELFRSGHEAAADALVSSIERDPRGLRFAEHDAAIFRARADVRAAGLAFYASGDFEALAAALEDSLRRIPPLGEIKGSGLFGSSDQREEWLSRLRPRLAGEPPPELEGLDEENQSLARAIADEPAGPRRYKFPDSLSDHDIPWLLPAAWTNLLADTDDVKIRVLRRGPAALPLLAALSAGDSWPAVGDWRPRYSSRVIPPFCTRADAADILCSFFVTGLDMPHGENCSAEAARLRDLLANATEDDVARFYLKEGVYGIPVLVKAWLARRACEAPIPWLEDDILAALQGPFVDNYGDSGFFARRALDAADSYLAVRGEAAAAFRDRLVEVLQTASRTAELPKKTVTKLPDGTVRTVEYIAEDPREYAREVRRWAADVARRFATLELASGAPEDICRRGEAFAAWLDGSISNMEEDPPHDVPCPLPLVSMSSGDGDDPLDPPDLDMQTTETDSLGKEKSNSRIRFSRFSF